MQLITIFTVILSGCRYLFINRKNLLIDFVINLLILTDWKEESYNFILGIMDCFTTMIYHKLIKIIINKFRLKMIVI